MHRLRSHDNCSRIFLNNLLLWLLVFFPLFRLLLNSEFALSYTLVLQVYHRVQMRKKKYICQHIYGIDKLKEGNIVVCVWKKGNMNTEISIRKKKQTNQTREYWSMKI